MKANVRFDHRLLAVESEHKVLREAHLLEQSEALANERSWSAGSSKAFHYDASRKAEGRRRSHRPPKDQL